MPATKTQIQLGVEKACRSALNVIDGIRTFRGNLPGDMLGCDIVERALKAMVLRDGDELRHIANQLDGRDGDHEYLSRTPESLALLPVASTRNR